MNQFLSPSRLIDFIACPHREALRKAGVEKDPVDAGVALIQNKGGEHESDVLQTLESAVKGCIHISDTGTLSDRAAATRAAMAEGASLIYQGALVGARWMGYPDFLVRCKGQAGYYYEPHDAKLGRNLKPSYVLQLSIYADLLEESGWQRPKRGRILLGAKDFAKDDVSGWVELGQFAHVTARLKGQYDKFVQAGATGTRAQPCAGCKTCPYKSRCEKEWRGADAVHFVAGIAASQREKLETKSVTSLQGLAQTALTAKDFGIGEEAFARIKRQAQLQAHARETGELVLETKAYEAGKGFALLPPSEDGDLEVDLDEIKALGAQAVLTLIEDSEFDLLSVTGLGDAARPRGMDWRQFPIWVCQRQRLWRAATVCRPAFIASSTMAAGCRSVAGENWDARKRLPPFFWLSAGVRRARP